MTTYLYASCGHRDCLERCAGCGTTPCCHHAPTCPLNPCEYEDRWTDEVGTIPVCKVHGNNSRHEDSPNANRPCLTVDPYPIGEPPC